MKPILIAYCGLNCKKCEAYKATIDNDDELRKKVAAEWSDLNKVEITKEMINCEGCRANGKKTPFCDNLCPIRLCALGKNVETCGDCDKIKMCQKIKMIIEHNDEALNNLISVEKE